MNVSAHGSGRPQERRYNNVGTIEVILRGKRLLSSDNNADGYKNLNMLVYYMRMAASVG